MQKRVNYINKGNLLVQGDLNGVCPMCLREMMSVDEIHLCSKVSEPQDEMHIIMLCFNYCLIVEPCDNKTFKFMIFSSSVMTEFQSKLSVYKLLLLLSMIMCILWWDH